MPCRVLLSGYWTQLYADRLAPPKWRAVDYTAPLHSGKHVREFLWCNFPEPDELHDYRYLGRNRRERERIRRMQKSWLGKLGQLPARERNALVAVLNESTKV